MTTDTICDRQATDRDMLFFQTPVLWPEHPFLPLVRRHPGEVDPELGLLYDPRGMSGTCRFRPTVFLTNLFEVPSTETEILALPKLVYASAEELAANGWTVD